MSDKCYSICTYLTSSCNCQRIAVKYCHCHTLLCVIQCSKSSIDPGEGSTSFDWPQLTHRYLSHIPKIRNEKPFHVMVQSQNRDINRRDARLEQSRTGSPPETVVFSLFPKLSRLVLRAIFANECL